MNKEKYMNRYRSLSCRLQKWDYGWDAAYFITICTDDRTHFFGTITHGEMHLSKIGELAEECWYEILNHAKNVQLGAFVVMPDHIHGILILDGNKPRDYLEYIGHETPGQQRFQHQGKNTTSSIIGSYKSAVSKHAHRMGYHFAWHSSFYDTIIRDDIAFQRITQYIIENPTKWKTNDGL